MEPLEKEPIITDKMTQKILVIITRGTRPYIDITLWAYNTGVKHGALIPRVWFDDLGNEWGYAYPPYFHPDTRQMLAELRLLPEYREAEFIEVR